MTRLAALADAGIRRIVDGRMWDLTAGHRRDCAALTALTCARTVLFWAQALCLALALSGRPVFLWGLAAAVVVRIPVGQALARRAAAFGDAARAQMRQGLLRAFVAPGALHSSDARLGARRLALTDGVDGLDAYLSRYIPAALQVWVLCPAVVLVLAVLNPWSGLAVLAGLALAVLGPRWWRSRLAAAGEEHWDTYERLSADVLESLRSMSFLRSLGAVGRVRARLEERSRALHARTVAAMRVSLADTALTDLGIQAGLGAAALLAAVQSLRGDGPGPAGAYAVLVLASEAFRPVRDLATQWHAGYLGLSALSSFEAAGAMTTTAQPTPPAASGGSASQKDGPARGSAPAGRRVLGTPAQGLRAEGLVFGYEAGAPVLRGASAAWEPGRLHALEGESGAGKSTLADLLLGLLEPWEGTVTAPERLGVVAQHSVLFPGTVAETLRTDAPDASEAELWEALEQVALADEVRARPGGLHAVLGEGGLGLSGGQRQRLAIARALLSGADALLLDEPTSALDDASAAAVLVALRRAARERTVLMIAHRPEALAAAETRTVLAEGRLA